MSCHLVTCLPEEGLSISKLSAPLRSSSPTSETGAIKGGLSNLIVLSPKVSGKVPLKNITNTAQNFPKRVQSSSPGRLAFISPSSKLIPSKFWKLILRRARTRLPALFKELFPYQDITGLSSAKSHGKSVVDRVFLSPTKSIHTSNTARYPQRVILNNSAKASPHRVFLPSMVARISFSPRRILHSPSLFPNGVIFSYRYTCNYHP